MIKRTLATWIAVLASSASANADVPMSERLALLKAAYPEAGLVVAGNYLVVRGGRRIVIDDGRSKSHQDKLRNADIEDMLSQIYPIGACVTGKPPRNFDPGRIRNDAFFRAVYGSTKRDAAARLVSVNWFGSRVRFTRTARADRALMTVAAELERLPVRFRRYLVPSAGTFNWRNIAGTRRLSAHSFGAAIDINVKQANYWRWSGGEPGNVAAYHSRIPHEIVEAFERHGFIWGGRWYHYDTMHFEYRPELIAIARRHEALGCK
jgi:D-alanyl-D-alanine carboxypeptidase